MAAVVITGAAIAPIGNPEHALDRAHRAADAGSNRAADHSAHGPGDPVTLVRPLLRTAHDTLGVAEMRDRKQGKHEGRTREMELDGQPGRQTRRPGLNSFHLDSLNSAATGPTGR